MGWAAARSAARIAPGCTGPTSLTSNTLLIPPRDFAMQKCGDCGSEFLTPRPLESELPPFYPSDYHAYNENHSGVARLLVQSRARSRARFYGRLIHESPRPHLRRRHRRLPALRRTPPIPRPGMRGHRDPARRRGQGPGSGLRRPRRDPRDRRPDRSCRKIRHRLHESHPRARGPSAYHARTRPRSPAAWWARHRPAAHRLIVGEQGLRPQLGRLSLPEAPADPFEGRDLSGLLEDVGFSSVKIRSAPHIQTTISLQNTLVRRGWRPPHAQRQDAGLRRSSRRRPSL